MPLYYKTFKLSLNKYAFINLFYVKISLNQLLRTYLLYI